MGKGKYTSEWDNFSIKLYSKTTVIMTSTSKLQWFWTTKNRRWTPWERHCWPIIGAQSYQYRPNTNQLEGQVLEILQLLLACNLGTSSIKMIFFSLFFALCHDSQMKSASAVRHSGSPRTLLIIHIPSSGSLFQISYLASLKVKAIKLLYKFYSYSISDI